MSTLMDAFMAKVTGADVFGTDMSITVGHIIDNPTFDTEFAYRIVTDEDDGSWTDLYNSRETDDPVPTFLLTEKITFLTIGDNQLIMEVHC